MDPLSIATASFTAIKVGVSLGKDMQSLASDIGKMWNAIDQINEDHGKQKRNSRKTVEEEALETFIAKKKAEDLENALRQIILATRGYEGWQELVRLRAQIRKQRLEERIAAQKKRQQILEAMAFAIVGIVGGGLFFSLSWLAYQAWRM